MFSRRCIVILTSLVVAACGGRGLRTSTPAPAAGDDTAAASCADDNLPRMTATNHCPPGAASPAGLAAEEQPGEVHDIPDGSGFVVVEAESLPGARGTGWQRGDTQTFPRFGTGASGGFVMWTGGHCTGEVNLEDAAPHTRQGQREDWLVLKFRVPEGQGGRYRLFLRTSHRLKDGDNDLWAARVGEQGPIKRAGFGPPGQFTWRPSIEGDYEPGVHAVYVAGRSACMAVDRLAMVRSDRAESFAETASD